MRAKAIAFLSENRGPIFIIGIVAISKFLVQGWSIDDWYLIPFVAAAYGLVGMLATGLGGMAVSRLYSLSDAEFKSLFMNRRVQFLTIFLLVLGNEYKIRNHSAEVRWIGQCVKAQDWTESGLSYPSDPVAWCKGALLELEAYESQEY